MSVGETRIDRALQAAMGGLSARQRVISNNVANVDTPGFKGSDVSFEQMLRSAVRRGPDTFRLARVANDLPAGDTLETVAPRVTALQQTSLREDGNNVDIDQQMVQLADTNINYNALAQLMNGRLQLLRTVINDGRR